MRTTRSFPFRQTSALAGLLLPFLAASPSTLAESVQLAWNANPESDIAGYRLYCGTTSCSYGEVSDLGKTISTQINDLVPGQAYYFVLTAYNRAGLESPPTEELMYRVPLAETDALPVAHNQSLQTDAGSPIAIVLTATSPDASTLSYTILAGPSAGVLTGDGAQFTYTPPPGFAGTVTFQFAALNGSRQSEPATVTITVLPGNQPPTAQAASLAVAEDTSLNLNLAGTDPDNNALTFRIVSGPAAGSLAGSGGNWTYTPRANFNGTDRLTFVVNDGTVDSAEATVFIEVLAVNDAPVASPLTVTLAEDSAATFQVSASDPDGNALAYSVVSAPRNGVLSGSGPTYTYTPKANFNGTDYLDFAATDGTLVSAAQRVTFTVTPVNDPPVAVSLSLDVAWGMETPITLQGTDLDGDALQFKVVRRPRYGQTYGTVPALWYRPSDEYNYRLDPTLGLDRLEFVVSDGQLTSAVGRIQLRTGYRPRILDAPAPTSDTLVVLPGTTGRQLACGSLSVLANDASLDGTALTAVMREAPSYGTVSLDASGAFTYQHLGGTETTDQFTYAAYNAEGQCNSTTVKIHVLQLVSLLPTEQGNELEFSVAGGLSYAVETIDPSDPSGEWQVLTQFDGEVDGIATITDTSSIGQPGRQYRIRCLDVPTDLVTQPLVIQGEVLSGTN